MKTILKTLVIIVPIITLTTLGCALSLDAKRPGEEVHVRIAPARSPAIDNAQE